MAYGRRPSLLGALLWIGFGVLFLLRSFDIGPDIWSLAARYWPVLLILLGVGKVLEYFFRKEAIAIRIGELIGIFFLVIVGTAITTLHNSQLGPIMRDFGFHIGDAQIRPGQWLGNSHTYTEETTYPIEPGRPIQINNSYGFVSVIAGQDREVRVHLKKTIYASETRARQIASEIHLQAGNEHTLDPAYTGKGKTSGRSPFVLRTNRETLGGKDYRFNTDLEVFVPRNSHVQVKNSFGEIRVAEISGNLDLSTTQRAIEVRNCAGEITIFTRYADCRLSNLTGNVELDARGRVYGENIRGNVHVTDEYSPIELFNVEGKVSISSTDGNLRLEKVSRPVDINARGMRVRVRELREGLKMNASHSSMDISDIDSGVQIESRYANINLKDIRGNIDINSNSDRIQADDIRGDLKLSARATGLRLDKIQGGVNIQTSLRDVFVNRLEGDCKITNEYGGIRISAEKLIKLIQAKNRSGRIELSIPREASFGIIASARNGEIDADYDGLPRAGREGNAAVLRSQIKGGGPKILLDTEYGNIRVSRGSASMNN